MAARPLLHFLGGCKTPDSKPGFSWERENTCTQRNVCLYIHAQGPGRIESLALFMMGTTFRITSRPFTYDHHGG